MCVWIYGMEMDSDGSLSILVSDSMRIYAHGL